MVKLGSYDKLKAAFSKNMTSSSDIDKAIEKQYRDKMVEDLSEDKVSIYEGVDRDVYKGGVAVTTDAQNYSSGAEGSWTETNQTGTVVAGGYIVLAGVVGVVLGGLGGFLVARRRRKEQ